MWLHLSTFDEIPEFRLFTREKGLKKALVTGANGLLGSHVMDVALERGYAVRALLLPGEPAHRLESLGIDIRRGDLGDFSTLATVSKGVEIVLHCASRKGPWGPRHEFEKLNVVGTRNLLKAATRAGISRFVYASSTTVLGADTRGGGDEDLPFKRESNPYNWSKIQAELLLRQTWIEDRTPVTVIRTGLLYGPRDTKSFARICTLIRQGRMPIIGSGDNHLPLVYVRDVAEALVLGAESRQAIGQNYNIVNDQPVTQKQYLCAIASALGVAPPRLHISYRLARMIALAAETVGHITRSARPPAVTRFGVGLIGGENRFSIDRARRDLGFVPRVGLSEGVRWGTEWFLSDFAPSSCSCNPCAISKSTAYSVK